ncbi:MAG: sugar ABC transporter substrate-binding protein [Mesorhizobium sp.]|uniref:sugar ABC transporter substrate-binding protein n=1 Tax=unclassified Mesorhizobium TaxID=325217 RepID=UPI000FCC2853|nr:MULTISPECIES: substrate-binding domain-containing protein [unclassified Mesorhizobium]RUV60210.1 sugar ABC transporter substrate-binding protein [Mesorhizobium sp. M5C.F.Ca.IN.020.29.1.1]RWC44378.1 MAG: sugar ABC transporter substrate-binding protein [Mesorhizobium sp.]RWD45024.1 MAG: sugar ABC transporter substrate-binding protein [Mesorhizobium sp.]RWE09132.1 MAG: sugar ABC transporter substrate-binding protein [Mesorhizobium sp.]RWE62192.1 MAG: sugar ABC transporter substrate-binding pro
MRMFNGLALGAGLFATIVSMPTQAQDATKVAAIVKGLDNPFFQYMQKGIEEQAKADGVGVTVQAAANMGDATGQADRLTAMAMQDFDCYLVNPISVSNLVQALVPVAQKNKPIVNIDSTIDAEQAKAAGFTISTYIGTDNVAAGGLAGEEMLKLVPAGSKVALVAGIVGDVGSNARIKGFKQAVEGKLEVVVMVSADWDREKALTAATDILAAHPDLAGFFAANDIMALGVQRAVQTSGKDVKVIGLDGIVDALKSVAAGELAATVAQYPYVVGAMGVEACAAAAKGKTLPANVPAPVLLINKDNAEASLKNFPRPGGDYPDPFREMLQQ